MLDLLRGFALLGILLVNIELMRGPTFYAVLAGDLPEPTEGLDRAVQFAIGWLATGKFVSSFAILFGIGTALMVGRAFAAGGSATGLLARRYGWLLLIGVAHMLLLFPGDILFVYGLTGLLLLAFVSVQQRTALLWSAVLAGGTALLTILVTWVGAALAGLTAPTDDPFMAAFEGFFAERGEAAVRAHLEGSYLDVIAVNAVEAAITQAGQVFVIPWLLGLFLFGFVVGRSGIVDDLPRFRPHLRRAAAIGLGLGLPLTVAQGAVDPIVALGGGAGARVGPGLLVLVTTGQLLGAPLLAVGYLSGLALLALRFGVLRPLAAAGRMALSAYLAQSALALVVFAGLGWYGRLTATGALGVVAGIWAVLLVACPLWLRRFRFGPVEWLWRTLTYGRRQPLRVSAPPRSGT